MSSPPDARRVGACGDCDDRDDCGVIQDDRGHTAWYARPSRRACAVSDLMLPLPNVQQVNTNRSLDVVVRLVPLAPDHVCPAPGLVEVALSCSESLLRVPLMLLRGDDPAGTCSVFVDGYSGTWYDIAAPGRTPLCILLWWIGDDIRVDVQGGPSFAGGIPRHYASGGRHGSLTYRYLHVHCSRLDAVESATYAVADVALFARDEMARCRADLLVQLDYAAAVEPVAIVVKPNAAAVEPDAYYRLGAWGKAPRERVRGVQRARIRRDRSARWWCARLGLEPSRSLRPAAVPASLLDPTWGRRILGEFCDVRLLPEHEPGAEPVDAHRVVLSFCSEHLRALFCGGKPGPDAAPLVVPACDARTLRAALDAFYGLDCAPRFFPDDPGGRLFSRWAVHDVAHGRPRAPRPGEPRYDAMVAELVALARLADALRARRLLDVCLYALTKPRMMRSPAQVVALLGALPRPCGGALAAVRGWYVAWLAFRQPELERSHPAWARVDAADRDGIARESDRLERARRVPDPAPIGAPRTDPKDGDGGGGGGGGDNDRYGDSSTAPGRESR